MCAAQHIQPDCHFAFSSYHDQFSLQSGKGAFYYFHGITCCQRCTANLYSLRAIIQHLSLIHI